MEIDDEIFILAVNYLGFYWIRISHVKEYTSNGEYFVIPRALHEIPDVVANMEVTVKKLYPEVEIL